MHIKAPGFPRHPKDEELVNNFMSGYSVGKALKEELYRIGYEALELIGEDFGWLIQADDPGTKLRLSVTLSSLADPEDDLDTEVELMAAIQPQKLAKGFLWMKKDISTEVTAFSDMVFGFFKNSPGIVVIEEFSKIK